MINDVILVVFARFLTIRPSDTYPYADEFLISDVLHDGIDAFVPAGAAAQADADSAQRQVQVVVDYNQIFEFDFEFSNQTANTFTAVIHKGLGFSQHDIMTGDSAFDNLRLAVAAGKSQVIIVSKTVGTHKSDVMTVAGVFSPRIP
jgi:hypothetical protein